MDRLPPEMEGLRVLAAAFPGVQGAGKACVLAPTLQTPLFLLLTTAAPFSAVKEKLRLDPDSEIATTGVRVSLICPVSRAVRVLCSPPARSAGPPGGEGGHSRHPLRPRSW